MNKTEIIKYLPVRYPREACRTCPACAAWMAANKTRRIGRPDCPVCHGDGRVPYLHLTPEQVSGRTLVAINETKFGFFVLKPVFGECNEPGEHRAMKMGSQIRCPGCDDLCVMPENVQAGDLITTDLRKKRRKNELYPLKTAL